MDIEKYLEGLPNDLKEKARACKSVDELMELARGCKVPIPSEALEAIAGGGESDEGGSCSYHPKCPECGSCNTVFHHMLDIGCAYYKCLDCKYVFRA